MDGIWYLLKTASMRNSTTENTVSTDIMKKPAIKGFNLILKIAGLEENGLTISSIDYTCFCSKETFNTNSLTPPFSCVCSEMGSKCLFIYIIHTQTHIKPGFWSIKPKMFERQGDGQESEEIVKMFLAHL